MFDFLAVTPDAPPIFLQLQYEGIHLYVFHLLVSTQEIMLTQGMRPYLASGLQEQKDLHIDTNDVITWLIQLTFRSFSAAEKQTEKLKMLRTKQKS